MVLITLQNGEWKPSIKDTLKADKRALEIKHEKLCAENKVLKNEKDDLNKELNVAKVALKTTRKEAKDNLQQFKKENKSLEEKIRNLLDFKNAKLSEERDLKIKTKNHFNGHFRINHFNWSSSHVYS